MLTVTLPFYEPSPRDMGSPIIQSYVRQLVSAPYTGANSPPLIFAVPSDQVLLPFSVYFDMTLTAPEVVNQWTVSLYDQAGQFVAAIAAAESVAAFGLPSEFSPAPAAFNPVFRHGLRFSNTFVPPGFRVGVTTRKSAAVGSATLSAYVIGAIVPRGNIGS